MSSLVGTCHEIKTGITANGLRLSPDCARRMWPKYANTFLVITICTLLGTLAGIHFGPSSAFMIYFMGAYYIAHRYGSGPAFFACMLSVLSFDYFIEIPRWQLQLFCPEHLFMFVVMFFIVFVTSKRTTVLEKHACDLEERVIARTKELANSNRLLEEEVEQHQRTVETLKNTVGELAKSNAALQQFARIASHDLQEPLRVIQGYIGLLSERYKSSLDHNGLEFLTYIDEASIRMGNLIKGVLEHASISAETKPFEAVNANESLKNACANLEYTIEKRGVLVTSDSLPVVLADPNQLVQVFQNLIGNAIKFQTENQPTIHVSAESSGKEWIFTVADNGIGMERKYLSQIFEMFKRLHATKEYPGNGLGLAICKAVVDRHHGKIWVESEPGKGSTFYFTIPAR